MLEGKLIGMSNYHHWTAGRHWREAMRLGNWIAPHQDPAACTAHATQALFHLAAAQLLLDHPPVDDFDHDWRTD